MKRTKKKKYHPLLNKCFNWVCKYHDFSITTNELDIILDGINNDIKNLIKLNHKQAYKNVSDAIIERIYKYGKISRNENFYSMIREKNKY